MDPSGIVYNLGRDVSTEPTSPVVVHNEVTEIGNTGPCVMETENTLAQEYSNTILNSEPDIPEIVKATAQHASLNDAISLLSSSNITLTENSKIIENIRDNYQPTFKDQVHSVLRPNDDDVELSSQRSQVEAVDSTRDGSDRTGNDNESNDMAGSDQAVIPMAEAFVITEEDRVVSNSSEEYPVVNIDEGACSTASPYFSASGSTQTRSTRTTNDLSSDGNEASDTNDRSRDHRNNNSTSYQNESSNSISVDSKLKEMAREAVQSERQFWVRIIVTAIVLNSLLVAGVVVAGFCATGACSSSSTKTSDSSSLNNTNGDLTTPSMAPTHSTTITLAPTITTSSVFSSFGTQPPNFGALTTTSAPTVFSQPGFGAGTTESVTNGTWKPDITTVSTVPPNTTDSKDKSDESTSATFPVYSTNATFPPEVNDSVVSTSTLQPDTNLKRSTFPIETLAPGDNYRNFTDLDDQKREDGIMNATDDSLNGPSVPVGETASTTGDDIDDEKLPVWIFILVAVVLECFIVASLVVYYRRWKRQRTQHTRSVLTEETSSMKTKGSTICV